MKKLMISVIIAMISSTAFAQITTSTSKLYYRTSPPKHVFTLSIKVEELNGKKTMQVWASDRHGIESVLMYMNLNDAKEINEALEKVIVELGTNTK